MLLADRLKMARVVADYTQQQIADILGIERSVYAYYESGKTQPSSELIKRLAALFRIDVSWFVAESKADGVLSESGDLFAVKREIKESGLLELSEEEKELIGLFRMIQGTTDKDKLSEVLKKFEKEFEQDKKDGE